MSEPTLVPPGGGEVIGDSPDRRVEILSDDDSVHATWSRFAPGRDGADLHVHRRHTDMFYVLAGELTVRLGVQDERVTVPAGRFAIVPPLVVHGFRNGGDAELRYLNFHAPGVGFADYMRGLRDGRTVIYDQHDPPADGGRPKEEAVIDLPPATAGTVTFELVDGRREGHIVTPAPDERLLGIYVLEGIAVLTGGEGEQAAPAGTWIEVPAGTPYALSGAARYLVLRG
jgi:mannose-6-phosphate isomerase-like protein (cupin superfamily)